MSRWLDRTFAKYLVVQVPGWILLLLLWLFVRSRVSLPYWTGVALLGAWIVKDLALYPLLRHAYQEGPATAVEHLIGARGVVTTPLAPQGYIRVRGELWRAEARTAEPVPEGSVVRISAARGLTLAVEPDVD